MHVADICLELHGGETDHTRRLELVTFLKWKLEHWVVSGSEFDLALHDLIEATLEEQLDQFRVTVTSPIMRGLKLIGKHLTEDGRGWWTGGTERADVDSALKWLSENS